MPEAFHYCSNGVTVSKSTLEGLHPTATQFVRLKKENRAGRNGFPTTISASYILLFVQQKFQHVKER
jgi:hypothetical protein